MPVPQDVWEQARCLGTGKMPVLPTYKMLENRSSIVINHGISETRFFQKTWFLGSLELAQTARESYRDNSFFSLSVNFESPPIDFYHSLADSQSQAGALLFVQFPLELH